MSQEPGPKDSIEVVLELLEDEPDYTMEEVLPNVQAAVDEHPRLRQVSSPCGLWEEMDVDVRKHVQWVNEPPQQATMDQNIPIRPESSQLRDALLNMPAFMDPDGRTPFWQVILSPRRLVMQIHHAGVDGIGLVVITNTLLTGASLQTSVGTMAATMGKQSSARQQGCCAKCLQVPSSMIYHTWQAPAGACCPLPESPIGKPSTVSTAEDMRHIHLGPYSLPKLKAVAKSNGVTVNSILLSSASAALRDYCATRGGDADMPMRVAVPMSFKAPDVNNPDKMKANNDFSTLIMSIPSAQDGDEAALPVIDLASWSPGVAVGAWAAQGTLSLLPVCIVKWIMRTMSNRISFVFSNVNGSAFGDTFVSVGTGSRKKVRGYAYGSLNGAIRTFMLVNSHNNDLHIGLTVDEKVVQDRIGLAKALNSRILEVCT